MTSRQLLLTLPVRKTRSASVLEKSRNQFNEAPVTLTPVKHRKYLGSLDPHCSPPKKAKEGPDKIRMDSEAVIQLTPKSSTEKNNSKPPTPSKKQKQNKENCVMKRLGSAESPSKSPDLSNESVQKKLPPIRLFQQNVSIYQEAKKAFETGTTTGLCGREKEISFITEFLEKRLLGRKSGSLYISGAPGTGKTACLNQILSAVKFQSTKYKIIFINCTNLTTPSSIFERIYIEMQPHNISKQGASTTDYSKCIKQLLINKSSKMLLILDEIDFLENKDQSILYTIFEWVTFDNSQLILIGIANALDLTNRMLPRLQIHSKCKPELLHFPPYTKEHILMILQERLKQVSVEAKNLFTPSALQFCARKVASVSGDIRKALDVCRRALELIEADVRKQQVLQPLKPLEESSSPTSSTTRPSYWKNVELPLIMSVINEVYGTKITRKEQHNENSLPVQQKILLCTLLLLLKNSKLKEVLLGKFHEVYSRICKKHQVTNLDQSEFSNLCTLLEARGLISIKKNKNLRMSKVAYIIDESEVEYALQDKCLLASILSNASCMGNDS